MKKPFPVALVIALTLASLILAVTFYRALDILGPRDKPDFNNMDWASVSISYWINTTNSTNLVIRTFTVSNATTIADLKVRMNIARISGMSIGTGDQIVLQMQDGEIWEGNIVFENRISLSKRADNWYSYSIDLVDTGLFDGILSLCTSNEQIFHPNAKSENIKLRSNLLMNYPPL